MVTNFLRDFKNYLRLKKLEKNFSRAFLLKINSYINI